jgi:hypothetical protein
VKELNLTSIAAPQSWGRKGGRRDDKESWSHEKTHLDLKNKLISIYKNTESLEHNCMSTVKQPPHTT